MTAAAHHYRDVSVTADDHFGRGRTDRRVVDRLGAVGADVFYDVGSKRREVRGDRGFQCESGVVGGEDDAHARFPGFLIQTTWMTRDGVVLRHRSGAQSCLIGTRSGELDRRDVVFVMA